MEVERGVEAKVEKAIEAVATGMTAVHRAVEAAARAIVAATRGEELTEMEVLAEVEKEVRVKALVAAAK